MSEITCKKCQSTYSEYDWKKNAFQVFDILDEINELENLLSNLTLIVETLKLFFTPGTPE